MNYKALLIILVCAVVFTSSAQENLPPFSFFVDEGEPNTVIIVGSAAAASDVVAATELAVFISSQTYIEQHIELEPEIYISKHESINPGEMVIENPDTLQTLWYFDQYPWGNQNGEFDPWETHEEIRIQPEDIPEIENGILQPDGLIEFLGTEQNLGTPGIIYVADNVRIPPKIYVYSSESGFTERAVGLDYFTTRWYPLPDPFLPVPKFRLLSEMYSVVDAGYLLNYVVELQQYSNENQPGAYILTGTPQYYWDQQIFVGQSVEYGVYEINLLDVDLDHNKAYLTISEPNLGEMFRGFMVLDPQHGFSQGLQQSGITGIAGNCIEVGRSQYDCAVISQVVQYTDEKGLTHFEYSYPTLVIDGIFTFLGIEEKRGMQCNIYTLKETLLLRDRYCCVPFVTEPDSYSMMVHFSTTITPQTIFDLNANATEIPPEQYRDYDELDYLGYYPYTLNASDFVFEAVVGLCDTLQVPICEETYLVLGPQNFYWGTYEKTLENPYFSVKVTDVTVDSGFTFEVQMEKRKDPITVKESVRIEGQDLVYLDVEFNFHTWTQEGSKNIILIGGPMANGIVNHLVGSGISQIVWEVSLGTWEYIPEAYDTGEILIIAGKDREATEKATRELINQLKMVPG